MTDKVYSLNKIKAIAPHYGIAVLYLFGSYACAEAPLSDMDFHVERDGVTDMLALGDLCGNLEESFDKKQDVVLTTQML